MDARGFQEFRNQKKGRENVVCNTGPYRCIGDGSRLTHIGKRGTAKKGGKALRQRGRKNREEEECGGLVGGNAKAVARATLLMGAGTEGGRERVKGGLRTVKKGPASVRRRDFLTEKEVEKTNSRLKQEGGCERGDRKGLSLSIRDKEPHGKVPKLDDAA